AVAFTRRTTLKSAAGIGGLAAMGPWIPRGYCRGPPVEVVYNGARRSLLRTWPASKITAGFKREGDDAPDAARRSDYGSVGSDLTSTRHPTCRARRPSVCGR